IPESYTRLSTTSPTEDLDRRWHRGMRPDESRRRRNARRNDTRVRISLAVLSFSACNHRRSKSILPCPQSALSDPQVVLAVAIVTLRFRPGLSGIFELHNVNGTV